MVRQTLNGCMPALPITTHALLNTTAGAEILPPFANLFFRCACNTLTYMYVLNFTAASGILAYFPVLLLGGTTCGHMSLYAVRFTSD